MNDPKLTGISKWRVVAPIPAPHPEMNEIPVGAIVITQTKLDSSIIIIKRDPPGDSFYDTHVTHISKEDSGYYLEVLHANIRWKPKE